jgi:hypothetical protein
MPTYLERYVAGEYEQVWANLLTLGPHVREESVYADALAVAQETMRRVRRTFETLIPRLEAAGYQFGYAWAQGQEFPSAPPDPVFAPPPPQVAPLLAELEAQVGALPLSLRAFYEVVGSVNFVGEPPPAWSTWRTVPDGLDALYVYPLAGTLEDTSSWEDQYGEMTEQEWNLPALDEEDPCDARAYAALAHDCWLAPIAPDEWFKYNISGCGAYEIATPNPAADARLLTERHRTTFVNYVRMCLCWAGFPKLEQVAHVPSELAGMAALTRDLLPF